MGSSMFRMGSVTGAKSEIRSPKSERSPKPEIRKSTAAACSPMEVSKPFKERAQKQANGESTDWMEKSEARNLKSERSPKSEARIETHLRRALACFCARSLKGFETFIGEQAPAVRFRCRLLKLGRIWSRHLVLFQVAADILRSPLWQPKTRPARCRFAPEQIPPAPSEQHRDWC